LIQSLATFSEAQQSRDESKSSTSEHSSGSDTDESLLFLRVQAAADFFTSNTTLMSHPEPVDVDIILDPYLANAFPRSLVPTASYIVILAIGAWLLSGIIWKRLFTSGDKQHND